MENEKWRYVCQVIEQGLLKATGTATVEAAIEKLKKGKERIGLAREAAEAYTDLLLALTIDDEGEKDKLLKKYTMQAVEKALKAMNINPIYIAAAKLGWQIGSPIGQFFAEKIRIIGDNSSYKDALGSWNAVWGANKQDMFFVSETSGRKFLHKNDAFYELRNKGSDHAIESVLQLVHVVDYDKEWVQLRGE